MGLGPHPVERARSGGAEGAQRPLKQRPHRLEATQSGPHMSGVGAPATRPRNCRGGPKGCEERTAVICLGLGPQLYGPEKAAPATAPVICPGL
eukprot:gene21950-biopygen22206